MCTSHGFSLSLNRIADANFYSYAYLILLFCNNNNIVIVLHKVTPYTCHYRLYTNLQVEYTNLEFSLHILAYTAPSPTECYLIINYINYSFRTPQDLKKREAQTLLVVKTFPKNKTTVFYVNRIDCCAVR